VSRRIQIAVTADLHWGHRKGAEATSLLVDFLKQQPPDLLILAGDVGTSNYFGECLNLFRSLPGLKAVVPGNHDLWVRSEPAQPDSLELYESLLPETARQAGFHYLDQGPLLLPEADLGIVGTINWYDHSWAIEGIRRWYPSEEDRLRTKRFTRGRHNDANYVRWFLDDAGFTARVVAGFQVQLERALQAVGRVIVVTHHPPFYGLGFPRPGPPVFLDSFLWDAFCGNQRLEEVLTRHADRIAFAFCGHTHRERHNTLRGIQGYNIGGDYHFKRLLWLEWPTGALEAHRFGPAEEG
jgi:predicted phosphohydrolase